MKIAILTQSTYPFEVGGAQLHTYYLAKALEKDQSLGKGTPKYERMFKDAVTKFKSQRCP